MVNCQGPIAELVRLGDAFLKALQVPDVASWITAIGTAVIAGGTVWLAGTATRQIGAMRQNQKLWATINACEKYDMDPILYEAKKDLWDFVYEKTSKGPEDDRHVCAILNYFGSLAIGIEKGAYDREIIKGHFENILPRFWGRLSQLSFVDEKDFMEVSELIKSWNMDSAQ